MKDSPGAGELGQYTVGIFISTGAHLFWHIGISFATTFFRYTYSRLRLNRKPSLRWDHLCGNLSLMRLLQCDITWCVIDFLCLTDSLYRWTEYSVDSGLGCYITFSGTGSSIVATSQRRSG